MKKHTVISIMSLVIIISACKKENPKPVGDNDTSTSIENAMADLPLSPLSLPGPYVQTLYMCTYIGQCTYDML